VLLIVVLLIGIILGIRKAWELSFFCILDQIDQFAMAVRNGHGQLKTLFEMKPFYQIERSFELSGLHRGSKHLQRNLVLSSRVDVRKKTLALSSASYNVVITYNLCGESLIFSIKFFVTVANCKELDNLFLTQSNTCSQ
jgi:hypothetical protein